MSTVSSNRTVNIDGLRSSLKTCIKAKRPAMVWGPPGVGKSDSIAQLCEEMNGKLYDIRLSLMEPTDLRGIPFYNKETGMMEWAPPVDLPTEAEAAKHPIVFVLFDEMNSAAPAVQAACYQIALNRKVGTYKLPDNVVIIAAGNRDGDRGVTYRMPSPLANRFVHFELRVDFEPWNTWAGQNFIHSDVVGFLNFSKNHLFEFDPASPSKSFATPRSWQFVSDIIQDVSASEETLADCISGAIGEGLALKFLAHRKHSSKLPSPASILNGTVKELKVKEVSAHYSLGTAMCYEMVDMFKNGGATKKFFEAANNFLEFSMNNFSTEVTVMTIRNALQTHNLPFSPKEMPSFSGFQERFGKLIMKSCAS